jgi:hypothetical protein
MGRIIVWNTNGGEDYSTHPNNFYIGRLPGGNPLGNPFTHDGKRTSLARLSFPTREQAIEAYKLYFKTQYGKDRELTQAFDKIYERYKAGEDVYLQCFCKPKACHGDFLAAELQRRLLMEKMTGR